MKIKKMILRNFRAYKDAVIEFDDFNCIIGKNDVGKSTIFAALDWFFGNRELNNDDVYVGIDKNSYHYDPIVQSFGNYVELSVEISFKYLKNDIYSIPDIFDRLKIGKDNSLQEENDKHFFVRDFLDDDVLTVAKIYSFDSVGFTNKVEYRVKIFHFYNYECFSNLSEQEVKQLYSVAVEDVSVVEKDVRLKMIGQKKDILDNPLKIKYQPLYANEYNEENYVNAKILDRIYNRLYDCLLEQNIRRIPYFTKVNETFIKADCFPLFKLDRTETSVYDYVKLLLDNKKGKIINIIKEIKNDVAQSISNKIFIDDKSVVESFDFTESVEILAKSVLNTKNGIPLKNRGEGFQMKIKNALFRLLSEQNVYSYRPILFAFEEPEVHLHPEEQRKMFKTLETLSQIDNYQVLITTHSPFIVKELSTRGKKWIALKQENGSTRAIDTNDLVLKYADKHISMNEINYLAFDEASIDYHIELFGYIQNKLGQTQIEDFDIWLRTQPNVRLYNWYHTKKFEKVEGGKTLPYCVRNCIDHPIIVDTPSDKNKHKAYLNNKKYNNLWVIKMSIEIMREAIRNNKLNE